MNDNSVYFYCNRSTMRADSEGTILWIDTFQVFYKSCILYYDGFQKDIK